MCRLKLRFRTFSVLFMWFPQPFGNYISSVSRNNLILLLLSFYNRSFGSTPQRLVLVDSLAFDEDFVSSFRFLYSIDLNSVAGTVKWNTFVAFLSPHLRQVASTLETPSSSGHGAYSRCIYGYSFGFVSGYGSWSSSSSLCCFGLCCCPHQPRFFLCFFI